METVLKYLPTVLDQPRVYLSEAQAQICANNKLLVGLTSELPGWVSHRLIAEALGYNSTGIDLAISSLGGQSYVWATEFENVHSTWIFSEPQIFVNGKLYENSESFYHAQKPKPFDAALWSESRVDVMRQGVRAKFSASAELRDLLVSSYPHPLLSLKNDTVWGFPGQNLLAQLLMEFRSELVQSFQKDKIDDNIL